MDYIQCLRTFVAIADAGTLAGGARNRGVSAPAVTRTLATLERHLGARLIVRTTRSLQLTEVGEQFLAEARRVLAALEAAEAVVTGQRTRPEGLLSVTAPELFGERYIAPLLFGFLDLHPQVRARTFFSNRIVNLIDEGFDLALRIADLPDSGLTAVPVGSLRVVTVAAPSYLARHGAPRSPSDLPSHAVIGVTIEGQEQIGWGFKHKRRGVVYNERLLANTNAVKIAAAVAGLGIARALAYQVTDEIRDGRLQILLPTYEPPPVPVHIVYPAGRAASAKVREFVKFAAARLEKIPVLQGKGYPSAI
jgi:DNA-binding transcriptional LysR family regulator